MSENTRDADPCGFLEPVVDIARAAGDAILEIYDSDFDVDHKEDESPLTEADLASHRLITARLRELTPDVPLLSEESAATPFPERRKWNRYWLVDPLDGTREFVKRNGEFTVNIALIEDHRVVLGVVLVPAAGDCYLACRGAGAFRQRAKGKREAIRVRRASAPLAAAGSRSHGSPEQDRFLAALGEDAGLVSAGSALKFCLVADGTVDVYPRFGPTSEWDTAAAQGIVEEAGGTVVDLGFNPLRYNTKESLLNPGFLVIGDPEYDWRGHLARSAAGS